MRVVKSSEVTTRSLQEAAASAYLESYGRMLVATAQSEDDRKSVLDLLNARTAASEKMIAVEKDLNVRLEQANRAAHAAATWGTLSSVFSLGTSIAMASASTGRAIKNPDGTVPMTGEQLNQALTLQAADFKAQADTISAQLETLQMSIDAIQKALLQKGSQRGRPADTTFFYRLY